MIRIISKFLEKQSVGFVTLTGGSRHRGRIISRFNNDPDCRVYVGSLKAGGAGIDLVAASVVIHYDRWLNAAREDQATDRVHRIGQENSVTAWYLVADGTIDEAIVELLESKWRVIEMVHDGTVVEQDFSIVGELVERIGGGIPNTEIL